MSPLFFTRCSHSLVPHSFARCFASLVGVRVEFHLGEYRVSKCACHVPVCVRVCYTSSQFSRLFSRMRVFFFFSTLLTLKKWEDSKNGALLFPLSLFFSLSLFRSCGMERIACHRLAFPWCAVSSVGVCVCVLVCVCGGGFLSANEFAFLVFPPSSSPIFSAHASRVPFFTQAFPRN